MPRTNLRGDRNARAVRPGGDRGVGPRLEERDHVGRSAEGESTAGGVLTPVLREGQFEARRAGSLTQREVQGSQVRAAPGNDDRLGSHVDPQLLS